MPTLKRTAKAISRTYMIYFHGGPLDGRSQRMPITKRWAKKNPRFINKSRWDVISGVKAINPVNSTSSQFFKHDCYYVAEFTAPMRSGDRRDYHFNPSYDPSKDIYFDEFPAERPVF